MKFKVCLFILILLLFSNICFGSEIDLKDLISYYMLDNLTGIDETGNFSLSVVETPTIVKGISINATNFLGDDRLSTATVNLDDFDSGISFSGWFNKTEPNDPTHQLFFISAVGAFGNTEFRIEGDSQVGFEIGVGNPSGLHLNLNVGNVTDGEWHFFVLTHNSTHSSLYIDGTERHTFASENLKNHGTQFRLGGDWEDATDFNGTIDSFGIWDVSLNQSVITELYNLGNGLDYPFNDVEFPNFLNFTTNNTLPSINETIQFNVTFTDNLRLDTGIFSWNCTNNGWDNVSIVKILKQTINMSFNISLNGTKDYKECSYLFYANDTSNNINNSGIFNISIKKQRPNITVLILDKPRSAGQDLVGNINFSDIENDTWFSNETRWYNNSIEIITFRNLTTINGENTSDNDTWVFSARVFDGFNFSVWKNDSVTINDTVPPVINELSVSSQSVFTTSTVTFTGNLTDISSDINANACKFTLLKSDFDGGNGVGQLFNQTTNAKSNDDVSFDLSMASLGTGLLQWREAHCEDSSANKVVNSSVGINITITTESSGGPTGGGGGGPGPPLTCNNSGNIWEITTEFGRQGYVFALPFQNARPVVKPIVFTNFGKKELDIKLSCKRTNAEPIDICSFITLSNQTLNIPPNPLESKTVDMSVDFPPDAVNGQEFFYNIVASDGKLCVFNLNNRAFVTKFSLSRFKEITLPDGSKIAYPVIVLSIISFLVFMTIGIFVFRSTKNALIGIFFVGIVLGLTSGVVLLII